MYSAVPFVHYKYLDIACACQNVYSIHSPALYTVLELHVPYDLLYVTWCHSIYLLFLSLLLYMTNKHTQLTAGVISSGNAWERRSQSYFDSGNGVPRNGVPRNEIVR